MNCPDCNTPLVKRTHFIGSKELPYWACPKCHDEVANQVRVEITSFPDLEKFKYVYREGSYYLVPKEVNPIPS